MQIKETSAEGLRRNYRIVIEAADIARTMEMELKALGGKVKIPGFRPGFVPMKVLQQRYGKSVQGDVLKSAVNDATQKVIQENKLRIALAPDVKVEDYKEEGDLTFTMAVDTMPEVPELAFDTITLEREVFEMDDAAVDDALKILAERSPTPKALPKTAKAEQGNVVTMDFKGYIGDKAFDGGSAEGFVIPLGSGRLIPGFEDQLVGVKAGDSKEVKVNFPDNYFNKDVAGKEAKFDVTVKEVAKLETPEVDEDFAKGRGFDDLNSFRTAVKEQLKKEYEGIVRTRVKKRLFDQLENLCSYPLPQGMVDMEFNAIWSRLQQAKLQDPDVYEGKPENEVKAEYQRIAERRVRLGILLAEIGQRQKIEISRDELTKALIEHAGQFPGQERQVFDFYRKNPDRLDELRGPILEDKAVDWILSRVKMDDRKTTVKELNDAEEAEDTASSKPQESKKTSEKKKSAPKKKTEGKDSEE